MGFLNPGDKPLIWRGPMLHSVMQQFSAGWTGASWTTCWSTCRPAPATCSSPSSRRRPSPAPIVVTTPSEVSLEDGRKAVLMFHQVKVAMLGLVENMSYLMRHRRTLDIFGQGGGKRTAEAMDIPFLGELPLDPQVRIGGDTGQPAALDPAGTGAPFHALAEKVAAAMAGPAKTGPKITLED